MTWAEFHKESERLANAARVAARKGDREDAVALYNQAAVAETQALNSLDPSKQRTIGITTVSATSLFYKAHDFGQAELLAHQSLTKGNLPEFAAEQLRDILQTIWSETSLERAGVRFFGDEILVSVKGGKVVTGGAPLDLVLLKVEQVSKFLLRTVEWLVHAPHRKREAADPNIESLCQPWVFQAAPGSYQFAVRMQEPPQLEMFRAASVEGRQVASAALEIMRASIEDPERNLAEVVPDSEYRATFLRMTRNLAPSGPYASFDQVEFRQAADQETAPVILRSETQQGITKFLRKQVPRPQAAGNLVNEVEIQGVLRNLSLDKDWIEVVTSDQSKKKYKILGTGDAVDDVIGPMVNKMVIVEVWDMGDEKYKFRDIRPLG
jgi:hypothetical protein